MNRDIRTPARRHQSRSRTPFSSKAKPPGPPSKLPTVEDTADLFSCSTKTIRRLVESGALPADHIGRLVRISEDDIAAFLQDERDD